MSINEHDSRVGGALVLLLIMVAAVGALGHCRGHRIERKLDALQAQVAGEQKP